MTEAEMHAADIERVKRENAHTFRTLWLKWKAFDNNMSEWQLLNEIMAEAYLLGERNEKERVK